jgi:hypothetical protein
MQQLQHGNHHIPVDIDGFLEVLSESWWSCKPSMPIFLG